MPLKIQVIIIISLIFVTNLSAQSIVINEIMYSPFSGEAEWIKFLTLAKKSLI